MKAGADIDLVIGGEIVRIEEVARRQRAPAGQQRSLNFLRNFGLRVAYSARGKFSKSRAYRR